MAAILNRLQLQHAGQYLATGASVAGALLLTHGICNREYKVIPACTPALLLANRRHSSCATLARDEKHNVMRNMMNTASVQSMEKGRTVGAADCYVHAESFSPEMEKIAGNVDFRGIMMDNCFLTQGANENMIERLAFGLKVFAPKGAVLIEEGSTNSSVYIVGHGELSVTRSGQKLTLAGRGQAVGLLGMMEKSPEQPRVTVESEGAFLLILEQEHFLACVDDSPILLQNVQYLCQERYGQIHAMGKGS